MAAQIADFDWEKVTKRGIGGGYSADEKAKLEALYSETLANVTEKDDMYVDSSICNVTK